MVLNILYKHGYILFYREYIIIIFILFSNIEGGFFMEDMLKKVFLAGIGTLALTYEKANEMVGTLVDKGKITMEQGKELNEELKRVINNKEATKNDKSDLKEVLKELNLVTKEDISSLEQRISDLEKNR